MKSNSSSKLATIITSRLFAESNEVPELTTNAKFLRLLGQNLINLLLMRAEVINEIVPEAH